MGEIWFTSDLHLSHQRTFLYEPRGFTSPEEMAEAIVERWNSVVKPEDTVYNLGDLVLNDADAATPYLQALNGNQVWLVGNHDTLNKIEKITSSCPRIHLLGTPQTSYATVIKNGKWGFYLSHYPTCVGDFEEYKRLCCICGHSHTKDRWQDWNKMCYHVEMDAHNCYPVNIEEIRADIRAKRQEMNQTLDFQS